MIMDDVLIRIWLWREELDLEKKRIKRRRGAIKVGRSLCVLGSSCMKSSTHDRVSCKVTATSLLTEDLEGILDIGIVLDRVTKFISSFGLLSFGLLSWRRDDTLIVPTLNQSLRDSEVGPMWCTMKIFHLAKFNCICVMRQEKALCSANTMSCHDNDCTDAIDRNRDTYSEILGRGCISTIIVHTLGLATYSCSLVFIS